MKKKRINGSHAPWADFSKFYRVMKLICLFMLAALLQVSAASYAQKTKLNVSGQNLTIEQVLGQIEDQSDFSFFYNNQEVDLNQAVSLDMKNQTIDEILDFLMDESGLTYTVNNKLIIIHQRQDSRFAELTNQSKEISGKVTDSSGAPLPGVTVVVKGTTQGTITDSDGNYSLANISSDATLVFSFVGMKTQEIPVEGKTSINVIMEEDAIGIEEVVAIGYGTMKKSDLTGSISSVSNTDFDKQPMVSLDQALQGRASGIQVTQTSGALGGDYKIRIRGTNSIDGNNNPIYVVDGFVTANLSVINVNDIESMEVLKDASATAIYGSRGANGVVLITTKRGKRGKSKVTFDTFHGVSKVVKKLDMMTPAQFAEGVNYRDGSERYSAEEIAALRAGGGEDWQENIFNVAPSSNYQLGFEGGNEKMDFYISGNYYNTEGIIIDQDLKRYLLRTNINANITNNIKIGLNVAGRKIESSGYTPILRDALTYDMTTPAYDENGEYNLRSNKSDIGNSKYNPIIGPNEYIREYMRNEARVDGYINVDLLDNLTLSISGGIDLQNGTYNQYTPRLTTTVGEAKVNVSESSEYQNTNRLTYIFEKNKSRLQIDAIHEQYYRKNTSLNADASGFISDNTTYKNLSLAEIQKITNGMSDESLQSFLGRINFSKSSKYLFTASIRADGASKFRKGNRWGIFPSGSAAWRISEEDFMKNNDIVNNLKLRLSYGITGSQAIKALATRSRPIIGDNVNYPLTGDTYFIGIAPSDRLANTDLTWEETSQWNFGLDLGLWKSKVNLALDVYKKHTYNLLLDRIFPEFVGATVRTENVGEVDNRGFEFSLSFNPIQKQDWSINSIITFSRNINEVVKLVDDQLFLEKGNTYDNGIEVNPTRVEVGKPISSFRGYIFEGVYQLGEEAEAEKYNRMPGSAKYKDLNNDDKITTDDITTIGDGNPDFIIGWNTTFSWKNFDVNCFITGSYGNDVYNLVKARMMGIGVSAYHASHADYVDRWTPDNPSNIPATRDGTFMASTQFLEDGSFISLKNISFGHTFDRNNTFDLIGLDRLRIYGSVENAFIITKYTGYDPETTSTGGSDVDLGIDFGSYPLSRTFTLGLNLTF